MSDPWTDPKSPIRRHASTPLELKELLIAERSGTAHLIYRDADRKLVIVSLSVTDPAVTIGRRPEHKVSLSWDEAVSRVHATLESVGSDWIVVDNGSKNGSFVNGDRIRGPHRLRDLEMLEVGGTVIVFRSPDPGFTTKPPPDKDFTPPVSDADRKILIALCRPILKDRQPLPASNKEIAAELGYGIPYVKKRLQGLFLLFGLGHEGQGAKRSKLAHAAIDSGLVGPGDVE